MEEEDVEVREPKRKRRRCQLSWGPGWKIAAWFGVTVAYLLLGGVIFSLAERPNERDAVAKVEAEREELREAVDKAREEVLTSLTARNGSLSFEEAEEMIGRVANLSAELALALQELPGETSPLWTFAPSVFFSSTIITTIGYGHIAPVTPLGQTLFIIYALIGIPICLIFLGLLGERLATYTDSVLEYTAKKIQGRPENHQAKIQTALSIGLVIVGMILFIYFPAVIFSAIEGWTYGQAVYYCFVSLTTVGFGDFVPAQGPSSSVNDFYRICSAAWIIVGLAWVALLLTKMQKLLVKVESRIYSRVKTMREKRASRRAQEKELESPATVAEDGPEKKTIE